MNTSIIQIIHHKMRNMRIYQFRRLVSYTTCWFLPWIISGVSNFMYYFVCFIYCIDSRRLKVADNVTDEARNCWRNLCIIYNVIWNKSVLVQLFILYYPWLASPVFIVACVVAMMQKLVIYLTCDNEMMKYASRHTILCWTSLIFKN
jgi:hypothetical protein